METDSTIELARIGEIPIEVFKIGLENDLDPLLLPLHAPQCACSMKRKNLLRRTCTSLFSKKLMSDSCANAQK